MNMLPNRPLLGPDELRLIGRIAVLLACIMCMTDRAHAQGSKVALLIGVERYEKRGFRNLNYAEDDMTALAKSLLLTTNKPTNHRS